MSKDANWSDIKDVANIDEDKIDFVYSCCNARLESTLKTSSNIDNKNLACIGLIATIIIALIGFLFSQINFDESLKTKEILTLPPTLIIIVGLFAALIILITKNMPIKYFPLGQDPLEYVPLGQDPQNLFNKKIMENTLKTIKASEIVGLKSRIDKNILRNKDKTKYMTKSFRAILVSLFISFFYIMIFFIKLLLCPLWGLE